MLQRATRLPNGNRRKILCHHTYVRALHVWIDVRIVEEQPGTFDHSVDDLRLISLFIATGP